MVVTLFMNKHSIEESIGEPADDYHLREQNLDRRLFGAFVDKKNPTAWDRLRAISRWVGVVYNPFSNDALNEIFMLRDLQHPEKREENQREKIFLLTSKYFVWASSIIPIYGTYNFLK